MAPQAHSSVSATRAENSASLTATRLQSSTGGERAKARAAVRAVSAGRSWAWGQRSRVWARASITAIEARAEGRAEAQLPRGFQCCWPGSR